MFKKHFLQHFVRFLWNHWLFFYSRWTGGKAERNGGDAGKGPGLGIEPEQLPEMIVASICDASALPLSYM